MNNEIVNTFVWEIGNFQKLTKIISRSSLNSQRFWLPQRSFEINNQNCDPPTLWEMSLYPNGMNGASESISLYLHAIQTRFEKLNSITNRGARFSLGIGTYEICEHYEPISKNLIDEFTYVENFDLSKCSSKSGCKDFIPLNSIFPEGDKSKVVNLFVQVTLHKDDKVDYLKCDLYKGYFDDASFMDIEFVFDCGSKIKAHRVVLSANSTYFKNMLQGQWKEKTMETIPIKETNFTAFRAVIFYIYSGRLMNIESFDMLKHIFTLADMIMLERLSKLVINKLSDLINDENWYEFFLLGWKSNNSSLRNVGLNYIADNWGQVKKSEGMLQLLASNNIEGIEELFYVANKKMEVAKWDDC